MNSHTNYWKAKKRATISKGDKKGGKNISFSTRMHLIFTIVFPSTFPFPISLLTGPEVQQGLISNPMLKRVLADSMVFSPPASNGLSFNSPSFSADH